eukprot:7827971-Pyramimonas_sp.AAC.1
MTLVACRALAHEVTCITASVLDAPPPTVFFQPSPLPHCPSFFPSPNSFPSCSRLFAPAGAAKGSRQSHLGSILGHSWVVFPSWGPWAPPASNLVRLGPAWGSPERP